MLISDFSQIWPPMEAFSFYDNFARGIIDYDEYKQLLSLATDGIPPEDCYELLGISLYGDGPFEETPEGFTLLEKASEKLCENPPPFEGVKTIYLYFDGGKYNDIAVAGCHIACRLDDSVREIDIGAVLGGGSHNTAEYGALIFGLKYLIDGGYAGPVYAYGDSMTVVRQVNGQFRCNSPALRPLKKQVSELGKCFESFSLSWVSRENNKKADAACKAAKDSIKNSELQSGSPVPQQPQELYRDYAHARDVYYSILLEIRGGLWRKDEYEKALPIAERWFLHTGNLLLEHHISQNSEDLLRDDPTPLHNLIKQTINDEIIRENTLVEATKFYEPKMYEGASMEGFRYNYLPHPKFMDGAVMEGGAAT